MLRQLVGDTLRKFLAMGLYPGRQFRDLSLQRQCILGGSYTGLGVILNCKDLMPFDILQDGVGDISGWMSR